MAPWLVEMLAFTGGMVAAEAIAVAAEFALVKRTHSLDGFEETVQGSSAVTGALALPIGFLGREKPAMGMFASGLGVSSALIMLRSNARRAA